mmetsp:Transcript_16053/g.64844  ORF Transcript_16053/g.64844 Transcript_16053/m.64844 type:complete len:243 (-) Transcript_16053:1270-1998(-)
MRFVKNRFAAAYDPTIENTFNKKIRFKRVHFATEIVDAAGIDERGAGVCCVGCVPEQHYGVPEHKTDVPEHDATRYSRLSRNASVGVHGYLLVYSTASRRSFEKLAFINEALLKVQGSSPGVVRVLVATMADLRHHRQVSYQEGRAAAAKEASGGPVPRKGLIRLAGALAERWHVPYVECSAKEDANVAEAFTTLIREVEKDDCSGLACLDEAPADAYDDYAYEARRREPAAGPWCWPCWSS